MDDSMDIPRNTSRFAGRLSSAFHFSTPSANSEHLDGPGDMTVETDETDARRKSCKAFNRDMGM